MPSGKSEIGRTEREAARRNKIFNGQLHTNLRDIDRNMKFAARQLDLRRQSLHEDLDSLETRSGWLRDTEEKAMLAMLPNRPGSFKIDFDREDERYQPRRSATTLSGSSYSRKKTATATTRRQRSSKGSLSMSKPDDDDDEEEEEEKVPFSGLTTLSDGVGKSQVASSNHLKVANNAAVKNRSTSSMQGAQSRPQSSQVRFRPATIIGHGSDGAAIAEEEIFEDTYDDNQNNTSPTHSILSFGRKSAKHKHRASSMSASSNYSNAYIKPNDPRYNLYDVSLKHLDVRQIRDHSRTSLKLRNEGRTAILKSSKAAMVAGLDNNAEYVPKRVKQMREEQLERRKNLQIEYNDNLVNNVLVKFKQLYSVPSVGGLAEAEGLIGDNS